MRKSEKRFLNAITPEFKTLDSIAKELGMTYEEALKWMVYLEKEKKLRSDKFYIEIAPHGYTYILATPLESHELIIAKKTLIWTIISVILVAISIGVTIYCSRKS